MHPPSRCPAKRSAPSSPAWRRSTTALSRPLDRETLVRLSRERAELEPVHAGGGELEAAENERADLEALRADPEMAELAEAESRGARRAHRGARARRSGVLLLPKDAADEKSAILEIRAGTGGDEAALFAGDLFRMYQRYADLHGWKVEVLSESPGERRRLQGDHRQRHRRAACSPG